MSQTDTPISIRPATAADQARIGKMVREAGLNTLRLRWENFLISEQANEGTPRLVGIGQLRPHGDGTQELASLVVVEEMRDKGVGKALVNALIKKADRPLYLMCDSRKVAYYRRFRFEEVMRVAEVPRALRPFKRLGDFVNGVLGIFQQKPSRLAIMVHRRGAS